ncbi:MAG: hypothetical protein HY651_13225 [Acidobacteria bacterium]|nr:hypothetical protein [Acidobacteriota bacterium]
MRMSILAAAVVATALACVSPPRADDQAEARAIVDKAIKAMGGEEKLGRFNAYTEKLKGHTYNPDNPAVSGPWTAVVAVQFPGQWRMEATGDQAGFTLVLNGEKAWWKTGQETGELNAQELQLVKQEHYGGLCRPNLISLKDKAFSFTLLGESTIGNRPAMGIKVSRQGYADVNMFFDKEHGLLIKSEYRDITWEPGFPERLQEFFCSDWKDVEGVKIPMKHSTHHDGRLIAESEVLEVKPAVKFDDRVFSKP